MPLINWEAVGAIAQLLGDLVVGVTLVYLAAQVRHGNRVARSQVRQRMVEQAERELYAQMADPAVTFANVKGGVLSEEEQARLALFLVAFMRQREWEWFQLRDGAIGEDVYKAYQQVIAIHLGTPRGRKWWKVLGRFAFNSEFVAEVDELLAKTADSTYLRDIRTWDNAS
jgi:hypothetical protein